jgi:hypothetical protein
MLVSLFAVDATYHVRTLKDAVSGTPTEDDTVNDSTATTTTQQQGLVDLVHLIPFDVQIAVTINLGIQTYEVSNIVTDWFNDAFVEQLELFGYTKENRYAEFNSVVLFNNDDPNNQRRQIQTTMNDNLFIARFRGGAVFSRDSINRTRSIPENDVLVIQQNLLLDDTGLLSLLRNSTDATGLGEYVIDVNAYLNPPENKTDNNASTNSSSNPGLDVVIIVAIVVALIAFLFLLGAIIWAYRFDRANRDTYLMKDHLPSTAMMTKQNPNDKTTSESDTGDDIESPERVRAVFVEVNPNNNGKTASRNIPQNDNIIMYPTMIGGNDVSDEHDENYPESVISDSVVSGSGISEDISTSLSQYYRAGMGKADYARSNGMLSDAGSVSSMESYGYSLDGGVSMAIPTEIPYQRERERIGGLPVEPEIVVGSRDGSVFDERSMDDVQIPDLDKELSNLDIKLLPHDDHDDNNETYSQQDLENYQLEDLNEMDQLSHDKRGGIPTIVSTTSSTSSKASSSNTNRSKKSNPIDMDDVSDTPDDENDDELLPKLPTTSRF